jgi:hypothetical protein
MWPAQLAVSSYQTKSSMSPIGRYCCRRLFGVATKIFQGPLMRFGARRYGPPHRFVRKRSPIRIGATEYCSDGFGQKLAFARFSTPVIFVFCNNIGTKLTDYAD